MSFESHCILQDISTLQSLHLKDLWLDHSENYILQGKPADTGIPPKNLGFKIRPGQKDLIDQLYYEIYMEMISVK